MREENVAESYEDPITEEAEIPFQERNIPEGSPDVEESQPAGFTVSITIDDSLKPYRDKVMVAVGWTLSFFGMMNLFIAPALAGIIAGTITVDEAQGRITLGVIAGALFIVATMWLVICVLRYREIFYGRTPIPRLVTQPTEEDPEEKTGDDQDS